MPPPCRGTGRKIWCPFNSAHPLFATSKFALLFMNIGFPYFDIQRRRFMSFAFIWTLVGFIIVLYGCLAVFNNEYIIRATYWSMGASYEGILPVKGFDYKTVFIGLRGYVLSECYNTTDSFYTEIKLDGTPDYELSTNFDDFECDNAVYSWYDDVHDIAWAGDCPAACDKTVMTAITSWFPMIFAMIGALNRMRAASDAPQQKILGCITDSFGAVSLAFALTAFKTGCHETMERENVVLGVNPITLEGVTFERINWWRGGGYWVYWLFCFSGGVVRATLHWLTPCPGCGAGMMTWKLPELDDDNPLFARVAELRIKVEAAKVRFKKSVTADDKEMDKVM